MTLTLGAKVADGWPPVPQVSIQTGRLGAHGVPAEGQASVGWAAQGLRVKSPRQLGEIGHGGRSPSKLGYRDTSHNPPKDHGGGGYSVVRRKATEPSQALRGRAASLHLSPSPAEWGGAGCRVEPSAAQPQEDRAPQHPGASRHPWYVVGRGPCPGKHWVSCSPRVSGPRPWGRWGRAPFPR